MAPRIVSSDAPTFALAILQVHSVDLRLREFRPQPFRKRCFDLFKRLPRGGGELLSRPRLDHPRADDQGFDLFASEHERWHIEAAPEI